MTFSITWNSKTYDELTTVHASINPLSKVASITVENELMSRSFDLEQADLVAGIADSAMATAKGVDASELLTIITEMLEGAIVPRLERVNA